MTTTRRHAKDDAARQRGDGVSPEAKRRGEPERAPFGREGEQIKVEKVDRRRKDEE
jgi:hypothetical protein